MNPPSTMVLFSSLVALAIASDNPKFTAVTSFKNMAAFYEDLRHTELPSDNDAPKLPEIKKRICEQITNSQFFRRDEYEHIDPESEHWNKKLRAPRNRDTFKELFKQEKIRAVNVFANPIATLVKGNFVYENKYEPRVIVLDELILPKEDLLEERPPTPGRKDDLNVRVLGQQPNSNVEHLFLCLTRQRESTKDFQKWYVSKEYNTRAQTERPQPAIAGRFVFKLSTEWDQTFELVALASEPALQFDPPWPLELYYLDAIRKIRDEAKSANEDPLCGLVRDDDDHCRLCSAVMNSEYFLWVAEKPDLCENVERRCTRMEVVTMEETGQHYFEYMTPCKTQSRQTKNTTHYYISRAYQNDAVLVFHPNFQTQGKMGLVKMFTNVYITDSGTSVLARSPSSVSRRAAKVRSRLRSGQPGNDDRAKAARSNSKTKGVKKIFDTQN